MRLRLAAMGAVWVVLVSACSADTGASGGEAPSAQRGSGADLVYSAPGLEQPVEILVDRWGVPHIYASTVNDAFYAQGFNAAKDRLWQIDFWRRRGLGKLAEVFGAEYVKHDTAARHFLYRGEMSQEWAAYGDEAKDKIAAFVRGVNDYIRLAEENDELLPDAFRMLNYRPELWQPSDVVVIRIHALVSNVSSEVSRSRTICEHGLAADRLRSRLEPDHHVSIPDGLDVCAVPDDVLEMYDYAHLPLTSLTPGNIAPARARLSQLEAITRMQGSNSWVIAGARSATGRAVLAGDPHRSFKLPSSRYIVHMTAPGLDAIGAGEPFAPGISMGHNRTIAYGLTFFYSDQEDLYVYELNPDNPNQYRYRNAWVDFSRVRETIRVRGEPDKEVVLRFSRHGPVVRIDADNHRAFAVRAAKLGAGGSPYLGSLRLMQAQSWRDFSEAMKRWQVPTLNMMYADVHKDIGWKPTGLAPYRENWDGLLPVPGDGRYEWSGFVPISEIIGQKSPERGWLATANHMNLPPSCDEDACGTGFEWAPPFRYERIAQVLSSYDKIPFETSLTLQNDQKLVFAEQIVGLLRTLERRADGELDALESQVLSFLGSWDAVATADSAETHFFMFWYRHYLNPALARELTSAGTPGEAPFALDILVIRDVLESTHFENLRGDTINRDKLLLSTLTSAYEAMQERFGSDKTAWAWGAVHELQLEPLIAPGAGNKAIDDCKPVQGVPVGGTPWTVNLAITSSENRSRVTIGASTRLIIDVGEWDNSRAINMPGQSGNHDSPNYCDLFDHWAKGETFPLVFSRPAVEKALAQRILLINDK